MNTNASASAAPTRIRWKIFGVLFLLVVVNMIDRDTWRHTGYTAPYTNQYSKQDMWKAQLVFAYSF